jgi:2-succinyl-5-enolpyruvyl-6-hydroxy-3-cyclohexene-1-carboxylate synthase
LPAGALLFVGNSMPVRDLDAFSASVPRGVRVLANRGANGIDGVISSALGATLASLRPTALLVGDLSFLHDAGALQVAARLGAPLLVVVINNDGGGIFHALPAAGLGAVFERCFATPHGIDIARSVDASGRDGGIEARRVTDGEDLERAFDDWLESPRTVVVEVASDRREAAKARASLFAAAVSSIERTGRSAA